MSAVTRWTARLVCAAGEKSGWHWYERYHATPDGKVKPAGPKGYCEYAAILVRVGLVAAPLLRC